MQVFIEERPAAASAHVAQDVEAIARFFAGPPRRTELWFGHFGHASSESGFRFGAGALARYAMLHRGEVRPPLASAAACFAGHAEDRKKCTGNGAALLSSDPVDEGL